MISLYPRHRGRIKALPHVRVAGGQPYGRARGNGDHRSSSAARRSHTKAGSAPASARSRWPSASSTSMAPPDAPWSRRQRKRRDGVRPWRRATDEIDAVVLCASSRIAHFSSRVHERRVPATTIRGEIVGPDIELIQAFATALYPSPGSYPARRLPTSAYEQLVGVQPVAAGDERNGLTG